MTARSMIHPYLLHPRTGAPLEAVGVINGRIIWPTLGASEPPEPPEPPTPPAAYTPPGSQADLDRIIEQRLSRERAKYADYDDLKDKAGRMDALELELASDKDKAVAQARTEERGKAHGEFVPRLVKAEFKSAASGVLNKEQLDALLEDLDLTKYVDDKGEADEEKIAKKVKAFAPNGSPGSKTTPPRNLGQGTQPPANSKPGDAGRAEAAKRYGTKTTTS